MFPYQYGATLQNQNAYEQNLKNIIDQANTQLQQMQQFQNQPMPFQQQPTNLTQNFQLAGNAGNGNFKIVKGVEDVQKEIVIADTYFVQNDNSQMWIKNPKGEIRTFNVAEVVQKDEKDIMIENLQMQIEQLKGGILNEQSNAISNDKQSISEQIATIQPATIPDTTTSKTTKRKSK